MSFRLWWWLAHGGCEGGGGRGGNSTSMVKLMHGEQEAIEEKRCGRRIERDVNWSMRYEAEKL